jgi:sterol desaturase/sphingolipid hydroxylase (fatty acid hydroxylase superfamily)
MLSFADQDMFVLATTPIFIFFILFEILLTNAQHRNWYSLKNTLQNFYLMLLNSGIDLVIRGSYLVVLAACWQYRLVEIKNPVIYWTCLVIGIDFVFYWMHRLEHSVRLFWAVHVTHHSSDYFNFTVGFRSSVLQPVYRFLFFIPLALLGFKAIDIIILFSASQIWGILVHTQLVGKLGLLEYFLVTPSHHRVHHASNPLYLDKNMGMFLIIWDKLFGTFQDELPSDSYQPIQYGLTTPKNLDFPFSLVLHEWKDIKTDLKADISWPEKLKYLFGPPGWSHDGSRQTSHQLRECEQRETSGPVFHSGKPAMNIVKSNK